MAKYDGTSAPTIAVQFYKGSTWTTVTAADVLTINIRRGRSNTFERDATGIATVQFNNTSGYYDPDYTGAGSPWVVTGASILRAGLAMRIVATWSATDYVIYSGYIDTTTPFGIFHSQNADQIKVSASTIIATGAVSTAISRPAAPGPVNSASDSVACSRAFASTS